MRPPVYVGSGPAPVALTILEGDNLPIARLGAGTGSLRADGVLALGPCNHLWGPQAGALPLPLHLRGLPQQCDPRGQLEAVRTLVAELVATVARS